MNYDDLFRSLMNLNNARRGSLGEYIFYHECLKNGIKIASLHERRVDFVIKGRIRIDVKTSFENARVDMENAPIGDYVGQRYKGIKYCLVELFSNGIRISIDGSPFSEINIETVKNFLDEWQENKSGNKQVQHQKSNQSVFDPIRKDIVTIFREKYGLTARVIYRTVQQRFGKESPDNLKPKLISAQNITVFIDFKDRRISSDNISRIIAFPNDHSIRFPMIKRPKLHREKIDIEAMDQIYKFSDVEDLYINFQRRFNNDNEVD